MESKVKITKTKTATPAHLSMFDFLSGSISEKNEKRGRFSSFMSSLFFVFLAAMTIYAAFLFSGCSSDAGSCSFRF